MIEQLTAQEVNQIILSVPKGVIIPGIKTYYEGEPIMIIDKPGVSSLDFISNTVTAEDRGFISNSGMTRQLKFNINEGSILYGLWSFIYGEEQNKETCSLKGSESIIAKDNQLRLTQLPQIIYLYKIVNGINEIVNEAQYDVLRDENGYYIKPGDEYSQFEDGSLYLAVYTYQVLPDYITKLKQIHNNIICTLDMYIDAVDKKTGDKYTMYVHCDRVQLETDFNISINNSQKNSFTPIKISSISQSDSNLNKDVATVMVIKNE